MRVWFRSIMCIGLGVPLVGALLWGVWTIRSRLEPESVRHAALRVIQGLVPTGVASVSIGRAHVELGEGLVLEDLSVTSTGESSPVLTIDTLFLELATADLATGRPHPRSVRVTGFDLNLHRNARGRWADGRLVEALLPSPTAGPGDAATAADPLPGMRLEKGRIFLRDESIEGGPLEIEVAGIRAELRGDETGGVRFDLEGGNALLTSFRLSGTWNRATGWLGLDHVVADVDLDRQAGLRLPAPLRSWLSTLAPRGRLQVVGRTGVHANGGLEKADLTATLTQGEISTPGHDFPLRSLTGSLSLRGHRLRLEALTGLCPVGAFRVSGHLDLEDGPLRSARIAQTDLRVRAPRVELSEEFLRILPEAVARALRENRVRGTIGLDVSLSSPGFSTNLDYWRAVVDAIEVDAAAKQFAYPVEGLRGQLVLEKRVLRFERPLEGTAANGRVRVSGDLAFPAGEVPVLEGRIRVASRGAAANPEVRARIPAKARWVWDDFSPVGRADFDLSLTWTRDRPARKPIAVLELHPRQARIRYHHFPLTIDHVEGSAILHLTSDSVEIPRLEGRYRGRRVTGNGTIRYAPGDTSIELTIRCDGLTLDPEVLRSLPEELRAPMEENRVSGQPVVTVKVSREPGASVVTRVALDLSRERQIIVHPPALPSPIHLHEGRVDFDGKHLHLRGIEGVGLTEFVLDGEILRLEDRSRAQLHGAVRNLSVDDRVLSFLGEPNRAAARALDIRGTHDFDFEIDFLARAAPTVPRRYRYRLHDLRSRDAGMDVGLRLGEIQSTGHIEGEGVAGESHVCEGKIHVDSARFNRLLLEHADVHFVYGRSHPALSRRRTGGDGEDVGSGPSDEKASSYVVGPDFRERLQSGSLGQTLQLLLEPARLYGGTVRGFCYADLGPLRDLRGHIVTTGIDIRRAARDVFQSPDLEASGVGSGEVRFAGVTGKTESLVGRGRVRVDGGNLAGIPILSSALDQLGLAGTTRFSDLETAFTIRSERFHVNRGELLIRGPAMNLRGAGQMSFNGIVDLELVPEFFPGKIGVLDELKKNLAHVSVTGPLSGPDAELVFLRVVPVPLGKP